MAYAIRDIELTRPLPAVALTDREEGVALLLRIHGRPVDYSMHALPPGTRLSGEQVWRLTGKRAAPAVLAQAIRDEIAPPPPRTPADVTVAVCTHGRTALLADLLRSVLALREERADLEILVVDNAPPDASTRELVEGLDRVRYVIEPRPGLDFARNRVLREAATEFVAFLDDDVVVDSGWLAGLDEALAENPDAGLVTGLVLARELETPAQVLFERRGGFSRGTRKLRYDGQDHPSNRLYPLGAGIFGAGANMTVRRRLALDLSGFDDALDTGPPLPGGGDLDMFYRVIRAGWPLCYEPSMLVFHSHRRDLDGLRRQYWSWGEGMMAFLAKTRAADPDARVKINGLVAWWLRDEVRTLVRTVRGWDERPLAMGLAELGGGLVGMTGSYRRSRRRTARIEERHAGG